MIAILMHPFAKYWLPMPIVFLLFDTRKFNNAQKEQFSTLPCFSMIEKAIVFSVCVVTKSLKDNRTLLTCALTLSDKIIHLEIGNTD